MSKKKTQPFALRAADDLDSMWLHSYAAELRRHRQSRGDEAVSRLIRDIESDLETARHAERGALAIEDVVRNRNAAPEILNSARRHHLAVCARIAALHDELRKAQQARAAIAKAQEVKP